MGLDDDVIDARLADGEFRARLEAVLKQNGHTLEEKPIDWQRQAAREYINKIERKQEGKGPKDVDPDAIPDEMVTQMLADEKFRQFLDDFQDKSGRPKLADLEEAEQRQIARLAIAAIMKAKTKAGQGSDDQRPAAMPDEAGTAPVAAAPKPEPPPPEPPPATEPPRSGGTWATISRLFGGLLRRD